MRIAIFVGITAFWFLVGSLISSWIDGNTAFAGTVVVTAVSNTADTVEVETTSGFPSAPNYIVWDNELSTYSGKDATHFTGLTRGVSHPNQGTTSRAASHSVGVHVDTLEYSVLSSLVGFDINAISTSYGSFAIVDFGVATWGFFSNLPRLWLFDYAFLKGPYNNVTHRNEITDLVLVRLGFIVIFTVPGIITLIMALRTILFG